MPLSEIERGHAIGFRDAVIGIEPPTTSTPHAEHTPLIRRVMGWRHGSAWRSRWLRRSAAVARPSSAACRAPVTLASIPPGVSGRGGSPRAAYRASAADRTAVSVVPSDRHRAIAADHTSSSTRKLRSELATDVSVYTDTAASPLVYTAASGGAGPVRTRVLLLRPVEPTPRLARAAFEQNAARKITNAAIGVTFQE